MTRHLSIKYQFEGCQRTHLAVLKLLRASAVIVLTLPGTSSIASPQCYNSVCQSTATKTCFCLDNMHSSDRSVAPYLGHLRSEAPLFELMNFRVRSHSLRCVVILSGGLSFSQVRGTDHSLRGETDRYLPHEIPRCQCICRCCTTRDSWRSEQHFLLGCPFNAHQFGAHLVWTPFTRGIRLFSEANSGHLGLVARHSHILSGRG